MFDGCMHFAHHADLDSCVLSTHLRMAGRSKIWRCLRHLLYTPLVIKHGNGEPMMNGGLYPGHPLWMVISMIMGGQWTFGTKNCEASHVDISESHITGLYTVLSLLTTFIHLAASLKLAMLLCFQSWSSIIIQLSQNGDALPKRHFHDYDDVAPTKLHSAPSSICWIGTQ